MATIIGVRTEEYDGFETVGHNCEFEEIPAVLTRYIIGLKQGKRIYELCLEYYYGQCGSGWCTSTEVRSCTREVDTFVAESIYPKTKKINFNCKEAAPYDYCCDYFSYSDDGGDEYYPGGFIDLNKSISLVAL